MLSPPSPAAKLTAIKAGKVVDPEADTTATDQVILIEDQTIIPPRTSLIDLSNATVLPGYMNAHIC